MNSSGEGSAKLVGFVCGTCVAGHALTEHAMSSHEATGTLLCVHSVVVDPEFRYVVSDFNLYCN